MVRQAFEQIDTDAKLAIVGGAPYAADYIREVRNTKDPRVILPGAIYGEGYKQLQSHCRVYVQATEVGGTHPALIEGMGRGALVLYLDTAENSEVAGDAAVPFSDDLVEKLEWALELPEAERECWGKKAMERIDKLYSWNAVTDEYERLFREM
jgi:glycosyltransferase involved in cell wall biosynthesis